MCMRAQMGQGVGWKGDGMELNPAPDKFCRAGSCPFPPKISLILDLSNSSSRTLHPGGLPVIALGWMCAVECWFASTFPIPSPFCLLAAEGPCARAALLHVRLGSCSPPHHSELSDPCHESPMRRL